MSELPPISQQPIVFVDATPDAGYPLRILRAYRQHCECKWIITSPEHDNPVNHIMNEHNEQRAKILDRAVAVLEMELIPLIDRKGTKLHEQIQALRNVGLRIDFRPELVDVLKTISAKLDELEQQQERSGTWHGPLGL